jgi:alpha-L-rhamnosidase
MDRTNDLGRTWTETGSLNDARTTPLIQPTILDHGKGNLQILCRSMDGLIYESWSTNNGYNWSPIAATALPNPNSGIDAVQLKDGRSMLIYNNSPKNRYPINIAVSPDGHSWKMALVVEATHGELSYPAIIQTDDGLVHITYTWKRQRIRHVVLDPGKIP